MDNKQKSRMTLAVSGALTGYISFSLGRIITNSIYIFFISMIIMVATLFVNANFIAKKKFRLKTDKDMIMFIIFWFLVWTIFFNISLYS
ncbi:MAG: hypothetical protein J7K31_02735 [Candidatus Aenigmarchaeota archaeon]|nr:hypothetical protein [Candidatus Aenigmarchaeota archaeon]